MPGAEAVGSISFPTVAVGWITTEAGEILRTTDRALTWTDMTNGRVRDAGRTGPT